MDPSQKLVDFRKVSRDLNGYPRDGVDDLIAATLYYRSQKATEVQGTNNANGTNVLNFTLSAGYSVIIVEFIGACNNTAVLRLGTGDLGSMTDYDWIVVSQSVSGKISDGVTPLAVITASSSDLTVRVYAPHTAFGATNDPNTNYFYAKLGYLLVKNSL